MDDLAFLKARLGEDEHRFRPQVERIAAYGWTSEDDAWDAMGPAGISEWFGGEMAARVLREVDAKRRILARYDELFREREAHPHDVALAGALLALDGVVNTMAAVYKGHPGYDGR